MTRILHLDTATRTGFCVTDAGVVIETGVIRLDQNVDPRLKGDFNRHPQIVAAAVDEFTSLAERHGAEFIVAEIPHLRGGSSFLTVAIYAAAQLVAHRVRAGFYGVHTASWQSRIIPKSKGDTRGTKKRSEEHVRELGFTPETDDEADAVCIAEYAHRELRIDGEAISLTFNTTDLRRAA